MKYLNVRLPGFIRGYLHHLRETFLVIGILETVSIIYSYITAFSFKGGPVSELAMITMMVFIFVIGPALSALMEELVTFILDKIFS